MKPNHLQAFQGKQLKPALQQFRDSGRFIMLFTLLTAFVIVPILLKTTDIASWVSAEKYVKSNNNFVANPNPEQIKALINNPVRSISIYPNPLTGQLTLSFDKTLENATVQVFDQAGKPIFLSEGQDGKTLQLDVSEFPKGNYLINVEDNHYNYYSSKYIRK